MGEVYRARDTKLNRDVAIKVLPDSLASDPDRLARFRREAHVLASLNHPNIAAIYGLEDSGSTHALVMELVPGRTLDQLIGPPMRPADVLPIAKQIASALEAAHEQGVVHRDLKPSNVKVTDDGTVKVLDFGLAKALIADSSSGETQVSTMTSPALTGMGVILGTAGYMSPEQAKGKPVDRRADIWALGVVMFELLAGRPLYSGETVTETIAHVITQPPAWDALPATTPPALRRLLRRLLEKDIRNRAQSAGDVRIEIDELTSSRDDTAESPGRSSQAGMVAGNGARQLMWWRVAALLASVGALILALVVFWPTAAAPPDPLRFDARIVEPGIRLVIDQNSDGAIATVSPNGQLIAYIGFQGSDSALYVRPLGADRSTALSGTEVAYSQFFSPDSRHLGFFANSELKRVSVDGGAPQTIAAVDAARGGAWGRDDTIVFTPAPEAGLMKVRATGGTPVPLTTLGTNERTHRWPTFLPDGKTVLFICQRKDGSYDDATIEAVNVETGTRTVLVNGGTFPLYVEPGYLVYTRTDTLFAVRFNPKTLAVQGDAKPVTTGVMSSSGGGGADAYNGASQISIASNGTAVYVPGRESTDLLLKVFITDRDGKVQYERKEPHLFRDPRFSPDGKMLALRMEADSREQIGLLDIARDVLMQFTHETTNAGIPVWSNDGQSLAYMAGGAKGTRIDMRSVDGSRAAETLTTNPGLVAPTAFLPGDQSLLISRFVSSTDVNIETLSVAAKKATTYLGSPEAEFLAQISPDGKWVTYQQGLNPPQTNVFVRAYPDGTGMRQVSPAGGGVPFWTKKGREIVYAQPDGEETQFWAVDVSPAGAGTPGGLTLGKPVPLFKLPIALPPASIPYAVNDQGTRFALLREAVDPGAKRTNVMVVLNFARDIERALAGAR
jgi:serine/threonine-protein kinase